jgi:hypothetical protein
MSGVPVQLQCDRARLDLKKVLIGQKQLYFWIVFLRRRIGGQQDRGLMLLGRESLAQSHLRINRRGMLANYIQHS